MPHANNIQEAISRRLGRRRLFYVCRDAERAIGTDWNIKNYFVISNDTPFSRALAKTIKKIILIKNSRQLDTRELLDHAKTKKIIKKDDYVLVFKNTSNIESICKKNKWHLLNPSAALAGEVENKISQIEWLGPQVKYLPKYKVNICKNFHWLFKKFVLQFNRSHTGSGTMLVESRSRLEEIKKKFPLREARTAEYIEGPLFTNNNIVWGDKILIGNINYQITGISPFTENPFATIGNDWALPYKILNEEQFEQYKKIACDVGRRLRQQGWRGLFGIDAVMDSKTRKLYLLEINARQPASTTYESVLQHACRDALQCVSTITTFNAHLASLLDIEPHSYNLISISDGAQIIQRVTEKIEKLNSPKIKSSESLNIIMYPNKKIGEDLARVQSKYGIMKSHNVLNELGEEIMLGILSTQKTMIWSAKRAGVILINNDKILLIKRNKYGRQYYAMPGGTLEDNESLLQTAVRETKEETNLEFEIDTLKKPIHITSPRDETYFFGAKISGTPRLGGPEAIRNSEVNSYDLEWIALKKLNEINLMPDELRNRLLDFLL